MNARSYREHIAAGGVDGIPKGSLFKANMLTDAGVQGSAKRYQARQILDEGRAAYAVNLNLAHGATRPYKMKNNPYSRAIGRQYYQGLGDDSSVDVEDSSTWTAGQKIQSYTPVLDSSGQQTNLPNTIYIAPTSSIAPPSSGGSASNWQNVLNTSASANLFSGIGNGLARLIGGAVPPSSILPMPTSGAPSMGTMLLIGGGVLGAVLLLLKKKR